MGFPKQIKKNIDLTPYRTLYPRRVELLDKINENGTFLPKSILHADLDGGFLNFVKNDLKVVTEGKVIPTTDILSLHKIGLNLHKLGTSKTWIKMSHHHLSQLLEILK